jgi:hypothetical protein
VSGSKSTTTRPCQVRRFEQASTPSRRWRCQTPETGCACIRTARIQIHDSNYTETRTQALACHSRKRKCERECEREHNGQHAQTKAARHDVPIIKPAELSNHLVGERARPDNEEQGHRGSVHAAFKRLGESTFPLLLLLLLLPLLSPASQPASHPVSQPGSSLTMSAKVLGSLRPATAD